MTVNRFKTFFFGLAILLFSNCTTPLPKETTDKFERLANAASSTVGTPAQLQRTALTEAQENDRLCAYLSGGIYNLGAVPAPIQISDLARNQAAAGVALQAYVTALVEASRGDSINKLDEAQQGFAASLKTLTDELETDAGVGEAVAPAIKLVSMIGEAQRQKRIRGIMANAANPLDDLYVLLERDVTQSLIESQAAVDSWKKSANCVLRYSRNTSGNRDLFRKLDTEGRVLNGQLALVKAAPRSVDALFEAHARAAASADSYEDAIKQVIKVLENVGALRTAALAIGG